jgi:K+-transporting ATPase ATPase A chain
MLTVENRVAALLFPEGMPQFVGLVAAVTVILCALTFPPALALGPLAEGIH